MTKVQVKELFDTEILPKIKDQGKVAIRCAWNDFVDSLQKDGQVTEKQAMNWLNPYDK